MTKALHRVPARCESRIGDAPVSASRSAGESSQRLIMRALGPRASWVRDTGATRGSELVAARTGRAWIARTGRPRFLRGLDHERDWVPEAHGPTTDADRLAHFVVIDGQVDYLVVDFTFESLGGSAAALGRARSRAAWSSLSCSEPTRPRQRFALLHIIALDRVALQNDVAYGAKQRFARRKLRAECTRDLRTYLGADYQFPAAQPLPLGRPSIAAARAPRHGRLTGC
jgi:hypothetical protein